MIQRFILGQVSMDFRRLSIMPCVNYFIVQEVTVPLPLLSFTSLTYILFSIHRSELDMEE